MHISAHTLGFFALALLACGEPPDDQPDCSEDRCKSAENRSELLASIEGFEDPIAAYLREAVQPDGSLAGDYREVLDGVGTLIGCPQDSQKSFMVLSNEALNPKTVFNRCASSPIQASEFFLLLPSINATKDVEPSLIHMVAWDPLANRYRRYATAPKEGGGMNINIEPAFCLGCHGGPRNLSTWQPLMNEMTNPWSQWNAEPGFVSHVFDEFMPSATAAGLVFSEVSVEGLLDSASNLEPTIRAGIDRVTGARVKGRHLLADKAQALELLQPLFCDEQVNYVSEIHGSGEFRSSALLDDSFRELFSTLDVGSEYAFTQSTTMRIAPKANGQNNLTLMAVRGESSLRAELALVTRQAITPYQALQVRSLDWQKPVNSAFRCGLFDEGKQRIEDGILDSSILSLGENATNLDLLPLFLAELMMWQGSVSLQAEGQVVYSIPNAETLTEATLPALLRSPAELAAELQEAVDGATRPMLDTRRHQRACHAQAFYPTAPIFPDIMCP